MNAAVGKAHLLSGMEPFCTKPTFIPVIIKMYSMSFCSFRFSHWFVRFHGLLGARGTFSTSGPGRFGARPFAVGPASCRSAGWAKPARTRSRRISLSRLAKTASNAAMARPAGVVRSRASVTKEQRQEIARKAAAARMGQDEMKRGLACLTI